MQIIDMQMTQLHPACWNPNRIDDAMVKRLKESITRYGLVQSLVVRAVESGGYEVLSGNQRLDVLRSMGYTQVPCVVVEVGDAHARLLAQALNRIQGEDNLGLKAELVRDILKSLPKEDVLALLPETAESLQVLSSLGQENMAHYLQNWHRAQAAKLKHLQFQLTPAQLEVVEKVLTQVLPQAKEARGENPNPRGRALYLLCLKFLEEKSQ